MAKEEIVTGTYQPYKNNPSFTQTYTKEKRIYDDSGNLIRLEKYKPIDTGRNVTYIREDVFEDYKGGETVSRASYQYGDGGRRIDIKKQNFETGVTKTTTPDYTLKDSGKATLKEPTPEYKTGTIVTKDDRVVGGSYPNLLGETLTKSQRQAVTSGRMSTTQAIMAGTVVTPVSNIKTKEEPVRREVSGFLNKPKPTGLSDISFAKDYYKPKTLSDIQVQSVLVKQSPEAIASGMLRGSQADTQRRIRTEFGGDVNLYEKTIKAEKQTSLLPSLTGKKRATGGRKGVGIGSAVEEGKIAADIQLRAAESGAFIYAQEEKIKNPLLKRTVRYGKYVVPYVGQALLVREFVDKPAETAVAVGIGYGAVKVAGVGGKAFMNTKLAQSTVKPMFETVGKGVSKVGSKTIELLPFKKVVRPVKLETIKLVQRTGLVKTGGKTTVTEAAYTTSLGKPQVYRFFWQKPKVKSDIPILFRGKQVFLTQEGSMINVAKVKGVGKVITPKNIRLGGKGTGKFNLKYLESTSDDIVNLDLTDLSGARSLPKQTTYDTIFKTSQRKGYTRTITKLKAKDITVQQKIEVSPSNVLKQVRVKTTTGTQGIEPKVTTGVEELSIVPGRIVKPRVPKAPKEPQIGGSLFLAKDTSTGKSFGVDLKTGEGLAIKSIQKLSTSKVIKVKPVIGLTEPKIAPINLPKGGLVSLPIPTKETVKNIPFINNNRVGLKTKVKTRTPVKVSPPVTISKSSFTPVSISKFKESFNPPKVTFKTKPDTIIDTIITPKETPDIGVASKITPKIIPKQEVIIPFTPTPTSYIPWKPTPWKPPKVAGFFPSGGIGSGRRGSNGIRLKQKKKYSPSLVGLTSKFSMKPTKLGISSGLAVRPVLPKKLRIKRS